jgi:Protein of unknown function (DUF2511)
MLRRFLSSRSTEPPRVARAVVRQADFGYAWPFTVPEGVLSCVSDAGRQAVIFEAGGVRYGVNGTARGAKVSERLRLADLRDVWRDDPAIPGAKVTTWEVIQRGLAL